MRLARPRLESMLLFGTALLLAAISLFAGAWAHYIRTSDGDWDYVHHTREVIHQLGELKLSLLELENSERGYLITGREALLERNAAARKSFTETHGQLGRMVADNPEQLERLKEIVPLFGARVASSVRLVDLRDNHGLGAAQPIIVARVDEAQSDRIETVIDLMLHDESRLLDVRRDKFKRTLDTRSNLAVASMVIILALIVGLGFAVRYDLRLRALHLGNLDLIAHSDALTGLANRRHLVTAGSAMLALAQRNNKMTAVLMLDLDGFKGVNDTLGHEVGDLLLREVARRLKGAVRGSDLLARLGGDEFIILLPEISDIDGAKVLAQKLVETLGAEYVLGDSRCNSVGTSIGLALSPNHGDDIDTLMRHADMALYAAKRAGKRQYAIYQDGMNTA